MLVKEDQRGAAYPLDNKTYYEATVIKTVPYQPRARHIDQWNRIGWCETLLCVRGGI